MISRVGNNYSNFGNYGINQLQTKPIGAEKSVLGPQYDNIFASSGLNSSPIGDSFQPSGVQSANNNAKDYDSPIGEAELSEQDEQILDAAMDQAGVPESLVPVAIEHLAAMNKAGSSSSKTSNTNNTNSNQDKIDKLAEFLQNYSEQFGDQGDIPKGKYLQNVSAMAKADMQDQGKPYIDPNSGAFDPKSSNFYRTDADSDYAAIARASVAINQDPDYKGPDYSSTGNSNTDSAQNYQDFLTENQNNPQYAGLSPVERQRQMYSDYKYSQIPTRV